MTGHAVTTNPLLIMTINMTIVFGVLFLLGYIIRFIYWIDPTKKKVVEEAAISVPLETPAASIEPAGHSMEDKTLVAVITTAIMAYGYKDVKITSIKKVE